MVLVYTEASCENGYVREREMYGISLVGVYFYPFMMRRNHT
jgi:hypothetical protein